jgi:hypothetical protein
MYLAKNKLRLAHLKLEGVSPSSQLVFCPHCDYQTVSAVPSCCPVCDSGLHVIVVTRDLIELVASRAPIAWRLPKNWFMESFTS